MNIGQIIKKLRRERDMTQEQLAEYLNISSQAVSRWETELAMPDITSLPMLANIFDVSVDHLLGVDIENKEKKINEILDNARQYFNGGYRDKAAEILQEGLKQYPNSFSLMSLLMYASRGNNDEQIRLGEKILAECRDDNIRNGAIKTLCYIYANTGKIDEAVKLAHTVPESYISRESLLRSIYKGNSRFEQFQWNIKNAMSDLTLDIVCNNDLLDDGTYPYSTEDEILIRKKVIEIFKIMFENEDYGFFQQRMEWTYIEIASGYAKLDYAENSLNYLELAKKHAILSDIEFAPAPEKTHTSILFKGMKYGTVSHNITSNDSLHQLEKMDGSEFDFIREDPRFIAITDELKKYAKKH